MSHYGLFVDTDKETLEKMTMVHMTSPIIVNERAPP